jgi:hypothetical protein
VSDTVFDETPLIYVDVLKTKVTEAGRPNDDRKIDHLWAGWLGDRLYRNVSFVSLIIVKFRNFYYFKGKKVNLTLKPALINSN